MTRETANLIIIKHLEHLALKYPNLRFGQLLVLTDIIELTFSTTKGEIIGAKDPFNEESKVTLEKLIKSKLYLESDEGTRGKD